MRLPSVKTLAQVTSYPRELRKVLECSSLNTLLEMLHACQPFGKRSQFGRFDHVRFNGCDCGNHSYSPHEFHSLKMSMCDELCETHGVEYIGRGHNAKSPAIEYLNAGDTYAATLMFVRGRYVVACWGDYVERGNYD